MFRFVSQKNPVCNLFLCLVTISSFNDCLRTIAHYSPKSMVSALHFVGSMAFFFLFFILKFKPHFFTSGSDDKESACNAGNLFMRPIHEFHPWVGKLPWRREWLSTSVFLPEEFHGPRSLMGYSPWGHKESDTTERLTCSLFFTKDNCKEWLVCFIFICAPLNLSLEFLSLLSMLSQQMEKIIERNHRAMSGKFCLSIASPRIANLNYTQSFIPVLAR